MNERIEKLSNEAYDYASERHSIHSPELLRTYTKQFAELIVKECMSVADLPNDVSGQWDHLLPSQVIKEHFGVGE